MFHLFTCLSLKCWILFYMYLVQGSLFCPIFGNFKRKNTYDTCKWSRIEIEKGKSNQIFSLTCYLILLKKSKILTRERKDIWQWFILGKFDTLTSIKKFSLKFFLTITMFNKNANKKKHLDIVQLLNIKYVLVKDLFFFLMKQKPDASKNFRYIEYRTYPPTSW